MHGLTGRVWGEFAYDQLAIPDSEVYQVKVKDFELALQEMERVEEVARAIRNRAFEKDPSATNGLYNEADALVTEFSRAQLVLQEIVLLRRNGLSSLESSKRSSSLEFQQSSSNRELFNYW